MMVPIGRLVVRAACKQALEWLKLDPAVQVFVNLSARELLHPDIVHDVESALNRSGLDASRLVLEVSESAMMSEIDDAKTTLCALKGLGLDLAIDDFGTGFSSLSHLRELPIDVLKIGKPIIDGICASTGGHRVRSWDHRSRTRRRARALAEGVESAAQHAEVARVGCDWAQGYHYSRPLSGARLADFLRESVADAPRRESLSV